MSESDSEGDNPSGSEQRGTLAGRRQERLEREERERTVGQDQSNPSVPPQQQPQFQFRPPTFVRHEDGTLIDNEEYTSTPTADQAVAGGSNLTAAARTSTDHPPPQGNSGDARQGEGTSGGLGPERTSEPDPRLQPVVSASTRQKGTRLTPRVQSADEESTSSTIDSVSKDTCYIAKVTETDPSADGDQSASVTALRTPIPRLIRTSTTRWGDTNSAIVYYYKQMRDRYIGRTEMDVYLLRKTQRELVGHNLDALRRELIDMAAHKYTNLCSTLATKIQKGLMYETLYTMVLRDIFRSQNPQFLNQYVLEDDKQRLGWYKKMHAPINYQQALYQGQGYIIPVIDGTFKFSKEARHYYAVRIPNDFDCATDSIGAVHSLQGDSEKDSEEEREEILKKNKLMQAVQRKRSELDRLEATLNKNTGKMRQVAFDLTSNIKANSRSLNEEILPPPKRVKPPVSLSPDFNKMTTDEKLEYIFKMPADAKLPPGVLGEPSIPKKGDGRSHEKSTPDNARSARNRSTSASTHSSMPPLEDMNGNIYPSDEEEGKIYSEEDDVNEEEDNRRFDELEMRGATCLLAGGGGRLYKNDRKTEKNPKTVLELLNIMDKRQKDVSVRDDLPKYGGNPREFTNWYLHFKDTLDKNDSIPPHSKLTKLLKALTGPAREVANTVPHNKHRYQGIITALKEAFGRPEVIMDNVYFDLKKFPQVTANDVSTLEKFVIIVHEYIHYLQMHTPEQFSAPNIILKVITSKLPAEILDEWNRFWPERRAKLPNIDAKNRAVLPRMARYLKQWLERVRLRTFQNRSLRTQSAPPKSNFKKKTGFNAATQEEQVAATLNSQPTRGRPVQRKGRMKKGPPMRASNGQKGGFNRPKSAPSNMNNPNSGGRGFGSGFANPAPSADKAAKRGNQQRGEGKNPSNQKCWFCKSGEHSSRNCNSQQPSRQAKADIIVSKMVCFNCLGNHKANVCTLKKTCSIPVGNGPCGKRHCAIMHNMRPVDGKAVKVDKKK